MAERRSPRLCAECIWSHLTNSQLQPSGHQQCQTCCTIQTVATRRGCGHTARQHWHTLEEIDQRRIFSHPHGRVCCAEIASVGHSEQLESSHLEWSALVFGSSTDAASRRCWLCGGADQRTRSKKLGSVAAIFAAQRDCGVVV